MLKSITVLVLAALSTVPAAAQDVRAVSFADLDLNTSAGQAALTARINRAARQICGDSNYEDQAMRIAQHRCLVSAKDDAQRKVAEIIAHQGSSRIALGTDTPKGH